MATEQDNALSPGTVVTGGKAPYRITSCLRSDGMGFTYRAELRRPHGPALQLVIREHFMSRCSTRAADGITVETPAEVAPTVDTFLSSFEKSSLVRMEASLHCPSIIRVLDTFAANGTYYYVVEFLNGETLEEYVDRHGPLSFDKAREILAPIFDAVKILHSRHIIHTDICPRHIRFLVRNGQRIPVLFNLYSSLHFNEEGIQTWSIPNSVCREGYAPPEQYSAIEHFYPQTDVYALAATLVFTLTGRHLPDSREMNPDSLREFLPPAFPETYVQALIHALQPDIHDRTASISAFREELVVFYGGTRREQEDDDAYYHPSMLDRVLRFLHLRS